MNRIVIEEEEENIKTEHSSLIFFAVARAYTIFISFVYDELCKLSENKIKFFLDQIKRIFFIVAD